MDKHSKRQNIYFPSDSIMKLDLFEKFSSWNMVVEKTCQKTQLITVFRLKKRKSLFEVELAGLLDMLMRSLSFKYSSVCKCLLLYTNHHHYQSRQAAVAYRVQEKMVLESRLQGAFALQAGAVCVWSLHVCTFTKCQPIYISRFAIVYVYS